jgi:hypothetical protein
MRLVLGDPGRIDRPGGRGRDVPVRPARRPDPVRRRGRVGADPAGAVDRHSRSESHSATTHALTAQRDSAEATVCECWWSSEPAAPLSARCRRRSCAQLWCWPAQAISAKRSAVPHAIAMVAMCPRSSMRPSVAWSTQASINAASSGAEGFAVFGARGSRIASLLAYPGERCEGQVTGEPRALVDATRARREPSPRSRTRAHSRGRRRSHATIVAVSRSHAEWRRGRRFARFSRAGGGLRSAP